MKNLLRIEEAIMFVLALYLNSYLPFAGWIFWALFLLPDLGMLGYLANPRIGVYTYNIFHHKGIAIAIAITGFLLKSNMFILTGTLLFKHASYDRIWGNGLKYMDDFKQTHRGWIK